MQAKRTEGPDPDNAGSFGLLVEGVRPLRRRQPRGLQNVILDGLLRQIQRLSDAID